MSRLGNRPIKLPSGVKVTTTPDGNVNVEGSKGKLSKKLPASIKVKVDGENLVFERPTDEKQHRADHGLVRSVINNMVVGVSEGFDKTLECIGVGYRVAVQGSKVNINVGYSHPVVFDLPQGITAKVTDQTKLTLSGFDKELLGSVADKIRKIRPPEPYKGKGIRYQGEHIALKEGKSAAGGK